MPVEQYHFRILFLLKFRFRIKKQFHGKWGISFLISQINSKLITFYTDSPPNITLEIIQQPIAYSDSQPVWTLLPIPVIHV